MKEWKMGKKADGKTIWKVLCKKNRKKNSYNTTTLNFFLNYSFLPVDTIITVWSECNFFDLCFFFRPVIRVYVETVLAAVWIYTVKPLYSSHDHLTLYSKWTVYSNYFFAADTNSWECQYVILYIKLTSCTLSISAF